MMIFPVLGSALSEHLGFQHAMEIFALVNLVVLIVFSASIANDWRKEESRGERNELEEESNLLRNN